MKIIQRHYINVAEKALHSQVLSLDSTPSVLKHFFLNVLKIILNFNLK